MLLYLFFMVIGLFIKWFSLLFRAIFGLVGIICCLVVIPLIANYFDEDNGWIILIITISIMGFWASVSQNSIFGFAGLLPSKYISGVMVGNGLSSIIFTIIRIICTLILPPDESQGRDDKNSFYGCLVFFVIGGFFELFSIIWAWYIFNTSFAHYHLERASRKSILEEFDEEDEIADGVEIEHKHMKERYIETYKAVMYMALQILFVFFNTFLVYPGVSYQTTFEFLKSSKSATTWFVIIMSILFSVFDTVGRYCAEHYQILKQKGIIILNLFRIIFIVTFILIAKTDQPKWLIGSDWFKIFNMSLFAFTNGYWGTWLMIFGPSWVNQKGKEKAGMIMNIHLVGGIFIGSLFATFVMSKII